MKPVLFAALTLLILNSGFASATPADAELVDGVAPDGSRYYQDSLVIHAPAHRLWSAFTDTTVYRSWTVPVAAVDFRLGGMIEASYDPAGHLGDPQNIKNAVIAYVPDRLLVFRNVQAPARLPGGEVYGQTIKTIEFRALDAPTTEVTLSGVGFAKGAASDRLYAFFSTGDKGVLTALRSAFETKQP
ncbi:MAG: SRPBCC domain-containing protein [Sphingomonadaceae bacterium]|nr:SRPBCC domain-containing protein [Sphingomonadaceae bacterium]